MTEAFARVYEQTATRVTAPIAAAALDRIGPLGTGTRLLDIAAGTGALSLQAASRGASVVATDFAPGMVKLLQERLAPFPAASVHQMDGEALAFEDGGFDAACSIFGVMLFADWRKGLEEQARVLRPGGAGCVATWRKSPGAGPFHIMVQALRSVFPKQAPPEPPEGLITLADPDRLADEMRRAGFVDVEVHEIDVDWEGPTGEAYLREMKDLHSYMAPYAALDASDQARVDAAILTLVDDATSDGKVRLASPALIAVGRRG
ncbi:class I SAM-dependent methyltransferase [Bosea thiooxidans]